MQESKLCIVIKDLNVHEATIQQDKIGNNFTYIQYLSKCIAIS